MKLALLASSTLLIPPTCCSLLHPRCTGTRVEPIKGMLCSGCVLQAVWQRLGRHILRREVQQPRERRHGPVLQTDPHTHNQRREKVGLRIDSLSRFPCVTKSAKCGHCTQPCSPNSPAPLCLDAFMSRHQCLVVEGTKNAVDAALRSLSDATGGGVGSGTDSVDVAKAC